MKLADQADHPLADHAVVDQPDAAGPVDDQRHDGLRKDHVGPQRQAAESGTAGAPDYRPARSKR